MHGATFGEVCHFGVALQKAFAQGVGDGETEVEGEGLKGLGVVAQRQTDAEIVVAKERVLDSLKLHVFGKAVLAHLDGLAVELVLAVPESATGGEKDR